MTFWSYVKGGFRIVMEQKSNPEKGLGQVTQKLYFRIQKYFGFVLWGY